MAVNEAIRRPQTDDLIVTKKVLTDILCTTPTNLSVWEKNQGLPRNPDNSYDLADVIPWLVNYLRGLARGKVTGSLEVQRQVKTDLLTLELKIKTGEVLSKSYVEQQNITKILAVKQALLGMGSKLAPLLANRDSKEIKVELDRETREIVSDFSGENIDKEKQDE